MEMIPSQLSSSSHRAVVFNVSNFRGFRGGDVNSSVWLRRPNSWRSYGGNSAGVRECKCLQASSRVAGIQELEKGASDEKKVGRRGKSRELPHVQTLREFPKEELFGKVVLVRFDSGSLLREGFEFRSESEVNVVVTIKYLYHAGAKVILVSDWSSKVNPKLISTRCVADILSKILELKVSPTQGFSCYVLSSVIGVYSGDVLLLENLHKCKAELANCAEFSKQLSAGIDIFVNDAFSQSHKVLASTVGVTRSCYASLAGFHFEESLEKLKRAVTTTPNCRPYIAIIGGDHFLGKEDALHGLASDCDALVFVGMMSFQVMHALGLPIPLNLIDHKAIGEAQRFLKFVYYRNIPLLCPKDFWCMRSPHPEQLELVPIDMLSDDLLPVDIGPQSLVEINSFLTNCKKLVWIGPLKFKQPISEPIGTSKLISFLDKLVQGKFDVSVVGPLPCKAVLRESSLASFYHMTEKAALVWQYLKGRKLHAVMALDRGWSSDVDWQTTYSDASRPLVVDIGSGNGMFLLGMAKSRGDINCLGLENNEKLLPRCLHSVRQSGMKNVHFIAANATSTFRSIVSSYPGELILVTVSCPNPDFNKPEHRWRMLQTLLVEAIADLLKPEGKVFLQSDIKDVVLRMREEFLEHCKGKLVLVNNQDVTNGEGEWLHDNPFGVRSDWEQHVLDRGNPMYRLMLYKPVNAQDSTL